MNTEEIKSENARDKKRDLQLKNPPEKEIAAVRDSGGVRCRRRKKTGEICNLGLLGK